MASFKTNPIKLEELLKDAQRGEIKLPEFQRSWVWDEERIKSLIASISLAFPVGALMSLETGGCIQFKERPVEGAPESANQTTARYLLLDGQQRITSLYQTCMRNEVVVTVTPRKKKVSRWFYFDIEKALSNEDDRESAIIGVPENKILKPNSRSGASLDLHTVQLEYENAMFPVNQVFDWDAWQDGFGDYWINMGQSEKRKLFREFKDRILQSFKSYQIPVIELDRDTSREAVCVVFEKVNTGGKSLDAFELVTAIYAAQGFELRKDWLGEGTASGRYTRLSEFGNAAGHKTGLLEKVASTDYLQAISLLHTKERRQQAESENKEGRDLPAVSATRQSLLNLPLPAYLKFADPIEFGFQTVARFLREQRVYRVIDIPYQSQFVPLAAIFAEIGNTWENATIRSQIAKWYWNGVFGELYGSTIESRFARDIVDVPRWLKGGETPNTIEEGVFRSDRLLTMRSRLSAAYKGVNALLMKEGARDFRSGQEFDHTTFFDDPVDIHHIFPRDWCKKQGIPASTYDSIINKTPLTARTNRILGGDAPSIYLARLENGTKDSPAIDPDVLDQHLTSHMIDPALLRTDDFEGFFRERQKKLLTMIEGAMGQTAYTGTETSEPEEDVPDERTDAPEETAVL